jgi:hypothetical protein
MRPAEIKRDLERLTVDAATARSQLTVYRGKLREASSIVSELRSMLSGIGGASPPRIDGDSTTQRRGTQEAARGGNA